MEHTHSDGTQRVLAGLDIADTITIQNSFRGAGTPLATAARSLMESATAALDDTSPEALVGLHAFATIGGIALDRIPCYGNAATPADQTWQIPPPPELDATRALPGIDDPALNDFNCPICFEFYGAARIYNCGEGHSLCHACAYKLAPRKCPQCKKPLCGRNVALEHAVDGLAKFLQNPR